MPEIEDVACIAGTVTVQYLFRFCSNFVGRSKEDVRVEISLQSHFVPDVSARFADVDGPVKTHGITTDIGDHSRHVAADARPAGYGDLASG